MSTKQQRKKSNTNGWDFLTNVFYLLVNKGVILPLSLILVLFFSFLTIPSEDKSESFTKVVTAAEHWHILGWVLSVLTGFGWVINSKALRSRHAEEIARISQEKTQLQEKLIGKKLGSTKH